MINLLSIWQILVAFEIALFLSYTTVMYIFSKKKVELPEIDYLPTITLLIPMYNEEKIIKEKIENTSKLDYPKDRLKIILLDDHSTDNSKDISSRTIQEQSLNANVIESKGGKGKARALNWLFPSLESEITVISDADALLKEDSLLRISKNFADPKIGGATGKIVIISDKTRLSKSQEDSYRFYFDIWRLGESGIQSVSVCNGPLMSFRTGLLKRIKIDPDIYADDSDMLFKTIRLGYRVIYNPDAIVYERVPLSVKGRIIQKMKRINGLRRVYMNNLDMLGKGLFGKIIYPYALMTHIISPAIILFIVLLYPLIVLQNPLYLGFLLFFFIPIIGRTLLSFMITQFIMNFSFLVPTSGSWEAVEDARYSLKRGD
jgi:cellulose synthase/poly-beta-1,6-N-acetylglucosamine synthase-like glycosyltransferase